jgi:MFS family permease
MAIDQQLVEDEPLVKEVSEGGLIALASFGHALCHIAETAFAGALLSIKADFLIDSNRMLTLLTVPGLILFGAGAVPAGLWADRRGTRSAILGYFLLVGLAATVVAITTSPLQLAVALGMLGLAISIYHPAGLAMLAQGCRNRGRAMGIHGVAGSLGLAIGPAMGLFLSTRYSWRMAYVAIAVCAALGLLACWRTTFPARPELPAAVPRSDQRPVDRRPLLVLAILFVAMTIGGFNYRCVITALPVYLSGQAEPAGADGALQESTADKSLVVFLVLAVGGFGQIAGGFLADRFRSAWSYALVILLTIPFALFLAHGGGTWVSLGAGVMMMIMFAQQPLENTIIANATPAHVRSTVYGLKFILAFGVASCGAFLSGWVWDRYGIEHVFDLYVLGAIAMVLLASLFAWLRSRM